MRCWSSPTGERLGLDPGGGRGFHRGAQLQPAVPARSRGASRRGRPEAVPGFRRGGDGKAASLRLTGAGLRFSRKRFPTVQGAEAFYSSGADHAPGEMSAVRELPQTLPYPGYLPGGGRVDGHGQGTLHQMLYVREGLSRAGTGVRYAVQRVSPYAFLGAKGAGVFFMTGIPILPGAKRLRWFVPGSSVRGVQAGGQAKGRGHVPPAFCLPASRCGFT